MCGVNQGGRLVQEAFLRQIQLAGGSAALFAALANHQASEQWRDPNMVPGMDTWLTEERWRLVNTGQGGTATFDQRVRYRVVGRGERDGESVYEVQGSHVYDATLGGRVQIALANGVTTIP